MLEKTQAMDILIIGSYPPPIGGCSVHVQRLLSLLVAEGHRATVLDYLGNAECEREHDKRINVLPPGYIRKIIALIQIARQTNDNSIVHFHVSALGRFRWAAPLLLTSFRQQPKVITIHSGSFVGRTNNLAGRFFLRWLLQHFDHVILVSVEQSEYLHGLGVPAEKVTVIPAFLPQKPSATPLPQSVAEIPEARTVVLTSGYLTKLYNYDLLLDSISHLEEDQFCFVFAFYHEIDPEYERHIYDRLSEFNNVIILRDQPPDVFLSVVERCDIYVRPTTKDGDAVAIREALQFRKQVFASDIVKRPDGCKLFSLSDCGSLLQLFRMYQRNADTPEELSHTAESERILEVYESLRQE